MIYYKLNSLKKEKMLIRSIKNNILADIFEDYFNVWAMDLNRSSIVRNINIYVSEFKRKNISVVVSYWSVY